MQPRQLVGTADGEEIPLWAQQFAQRPLIQLPRAGHLGKVPDEGFEILVQTQYHGLRMGLADQIPLGVLGGRFLCRALPRQVIVALHGRGVVRVDRGTTAAAPGRPLTGCPDGDADAVRPIRIALFFHSARSFVSGRARCLGGPVGGAASRGDGGRVPHDECATTVQSHQVLSVG